MSDTERVGTSPALEAQKNPLRIICLIGQKKNGKCALLEHAMKPLKEHFVVVTTRNQAFNPKDDEICIENGTASIPHGKSDIVLMHRIYRTLEEVRKVGKIVILYGFPSNEEQAILLADEMISDDYNLERVIVIRDPSNKNDGYDRTEAAILNVLAGEIGASVSEISEKSRFCAQKRLNAILTEIADI